MSFLRYSAVGGAATAVHYGVLAGLVERAGMRSELAAAIGAVCGAIAAYVGNRRFTFAAAVPHRFALPRFVAAAVASALLSAATVWWLDAALGVHYLLAQAVATALTLGGGYLLNKHWAFRP